MVPIHIQKDDGFRHRHDIFQLWDRCLPGTPHERFEWMHKGNPAGGTIWYLACTHEGNELIGTATLMPKVFYRGGEKVRGAILGDIMVKESHQHKGVAARIQQHIHADMQSLGFAFIYVVPNANARNMLLRSGYSVHDHMDTMVRPVAFEHYFKCNATICTQVAFPLLRAFMSVTGFRTPWSKKVGFTWLGEFPPPVEDVHGDILKHDDVFRGDHDPSYLVWRYGKDPHARFSTLMMNSLNGMMLGYLIFTVLEKKVHIYDIVCSSLQYRNWMLNEMVCYAEKNSLIGLYIGAARQNPLVTSLRSKWFLSTGDSSDILMYGNDSIGRYPWVFFSADRNI